MLDAINGLSDVAFVLLILAVLATLLLLMQMAATMLRGVGVSWPYVIAFLGLWIAFWLVTR